MNDGLHVRALAVDPHVEAHARVGSSTGKRLEILVDQHHAVRGGFVEAVAELERPPGIGLVRPCGDLSGEAGLVAFGGQDAARDGQHFRRGFS